MLWVIQGVHRIIFNLVLCLDRRRIFLLYISWILLHPLVLNSSLLYFLSSKKIRFRMENSNPAKKLRFDEAAKGNDVTGRYAQHHSEFRMDCIPKNHYHLGGDVFAAVSCFLGHTRVHIRRYLPAADGNILPTKDGVSLSPSVWESLQRQLNTYVTFADNDTVLVILKDLFVSKEKADGRLRVNFQRMFRKKDLTYQFVPQCVSLEHFQIRKLCNYMNAISEALRDTLLCHTLEYYVLQKLKDFPSVKMSEYCGDPDNPEGLEELTLSVSTILKDFISKHMKKHIDCFGCMSDLECRYAHMCTQMDHTDKWDNYYELALYDINWVEVAEKIVNDNVKFDYFWYLVKVFDFFESLDSKSIYKSMKNMYIKDDPYSFYTAIM